jgi:hypothetical protein
VAAAAHGLERDVGDQVGTGLHSASRIVDGMNSISV